MRKTRWWSAKLDGLKLREHGQGIEDCARVVSLLLMESVQMLLKLINNLNLQIQHPIYVTSITLVVCVKLYWAMINQ